MIYIQKKRTPSYLTNEVQKNRAIMSVPQIYESMDSGVKRKLYADILEEQHYLCAYCMSRIDFPENTSPSQKVTIDHYRSQAHNPDSAMSYGNMLGSCVRCQNNKGSEELSVNPLNKDDISTVSYLSSGEIRSSRPDIEKDFELLELNSEFLRGARKAVRGAFIERLRSKYGGGKITVGEWNRIKRVLSDKEKYDPFIGIVIWFIEKQIRKAC